MSGKKHQGHGAAPPAPTPETPPATPVAEPVAPDTLTATTPVGTLPSESFEPPLPIPPANPDVSPQAVREQLAELSLAREKLEEDRKNLELEHEGLAKARGLLETDQEQLDASRAELSTALAELAKARGDLDVDREAFDDLRNPKPKGEPKIVKVKALRGVTDPLRIQHRQPGEEFRVREDDAKHLESLGDVEIL